MRKLTKKQTIVIIIVESILLIAWLFIFPKMIMVQYPTIILLLGGAIIGVIVAALICTISLFIDMCTDSKNEKGEQKEQKPEEREYNPKDIFLLTTEITSNYNDGSGFGPRVITEYYLATKKDENFYELFSKVKIEKEEDTHSEGVCCKNFNTPYITQVEPLTDYVRNPNKKLTADLLFGFITEANTDIRIKDLTGTDEDDEENDDDEVEEE